MACSSRRYVLLFAALGGLACSQSGSARTQAGGTGGGNREAGPGAGGGSIGTSGGGAGGPSVMSAGSGGSVTGGSSLVGGGSGGGGAGGSSAMSAGSGGSVTGGSSLVGGGSGGRGTGGSSVADAGSSGRGSAGVQAGTADAAPAGGSLIADPGSEGDGDFTIGPNYTTQPELTEKGAAKGKSFSFTMSSSNSQIYKGTDTTLNAPMAFTRNVSVYVPAQYQDGTAAPILVIHDGPGPINLVKLALDNLTISPDPARKLPAFVAIAVANGGGDGKGSERGLEYDTVSDRFARFIDGEVLPAVLGNATIRAAYPSLAFTKDPEGRATMGCSSGGAAAFTMGWLRPDLFRRIITYSATLADQQDDDAPEEAMYPLGAAEYHSGLALVAAEPRKELRIFLHAGQMDVPAILTGNQHTAAALKAKDYHYRFVVALSSGHCASTNYPSTLADTLVWMWRGYPGGAP